MEEIARLFLFELPSMKDIFEPGGAAKRYGRESGEWGRSFN